MKLKLNGLHYFYEIQKVDLYGLFVRKTRKLEPGGEIRLPEGPTLCDASLKKLFDDCYIEETKIENGKVHLLKEIVCNAGGPVTGKFADLLTAMYPFQEINYYILTV